MTELAPQSLKNTINLESRNGLREAASSLMDKVTLNPTIESAWLTALARMEEVAADQIRTNISAFTPTAEREAIFEHAADEDRHARLILAMRPMSFLPDARHEALKNRLCHLAERFVVGYFGNPLLITAKNKHAAYAHGAITIEQFPFQVYVAYLKATQLPAVNEGLPGVIRDEQAHLALGRRLIDQLPQEERFSIEHLLKIEEDMCATMLRRMDAVMSEFLSDSACIGSFEEAISHSPHATIAWAFTLGCAEELAASHMEKIYTGRGLTLPQMMPAHIADEVRHAKMLKRAVLIERRRLASQEVGYLKLERAFLRGIRLYQMKLFSSLMNQTNNPDAIYLYGALALETRVFKHYKELAQETDHIGLSHVLSVILEEEAEHTRLATAALREQGLSMEEFREIAKLEKVHWEEMIESAATRLDQFVVPTQIESLA